MKKYIFAIALMVTAVAVADDILTPKFPLAVWDGTSTTRPDRTSHRGPTAEDYERISAEVIALQKYATDVQALGSVTTGTKTVDLTKGRTITVTVGGNFTLAFSNAPVNAYSVRLIITNGSAHTITWPTITWQTSDTNAPALLASGVDLVDIVSPDGGTTLYGFHLPQLQTTDIASGAVTQAKVTYTGLKTYAAAGHNNTGALTTTGTVIGNRVIAIFGTPTAGGVLSSYVPGTDFESTVTVNDQIQQLSASNLSTSTLIFIVVPARS